MKTIPSNNHFPGNQDNRIEQLIELNLEMIAYTQNTNLHFRDRGKFIEFLTVYIDALYQQRSSFANDVGISYFALKQIINQQKEPQRRFIRQLIIHSKRSIGTSLNFDFNLWNEVYIRDKMAHLLSSSCQSNKA